MCLGRVDICTARGVVLATGFLFARAFVLSGNPLSVEKADFQRSSLLTNCVILIERDGKLADYAFDALAVASAQSVRIPADHGTLQFARQ